MGMVAPEQRIASAFFVLHGKYGEVTRYVQERVVSRQWIYRETAQQQIEKLRQQRRQAYQQRAELETRLAQAALLDAQKPEELACVGQACGVSFRPNLECDRVGPTHASLRQAGGSLSKSAVQPGLRS